jgi:dihydrofolate reductase
MDVLPPVSIVASATVFGGVAKDGAVPWASVRGIQRRLHHLLETTSCPEKRNVVIVGWKTWLSHNFPASRCMVVVLTKRHGVSGQRVAPHVHHRHNLITAITEFSSRPDVDRVFIGGGPSIWGQALQLGIVTTLYITRVLTPRPCDTFFPDVSNLPLRLVEQGAREEEKGISKDATTEFQNMVYAVGDQVGDQFFSSPSVQPSVPTFL